MPVPIHNPTKDAAQITPTYVDVVHNITAQPEVNQLYTQWFGFPILECWLYSSIHQDCLGAQLKVRSSFMRAYVLPVMGELFTQHDPSYYSDPTCKLCHGRR